jgi:cytochrome P450
MMALTSSIVAKTLFDADVSKDTDTVGQAMAILQDAAIKQFHPIWRVLSILPTRQRRQEARAMQALDTIIFRIIDERRVSGADKGDLLSMLLLAEDEDGSRKSTQQVRDEVISLFLAGHETTANLLTWTWYLLALHPEVADRLRQELAEVLGGHLPGVRDVARLPYTAMIIKEALRLYPSAWIITREAIADVEIGGYTLQAGSVVVISPYITHRHPRFYPDPGQFRPERFAPGYEQSLPRFAYFPFGGGPRICIGQSFAMLEASLILATIAQRYRLTLAPNQKIEMEPLITLRARHGIHMGPVRHSSHSL